MSLFDPPFQFSYHCRKCKTRHQEVRQVLAFKSRMCPKCNRPMLEKRVIHVGLGTDTEFMAGVNEDDGFGNVEWMRKLARKKAADAGVNVAGARYCSQLNAPGKSLSPEAWVRNKSDVKRRCKELEVGCNGSVTVQAPEHEIVKKPYRISEKHLNREMKKLTKDQHLTPQQTMDLREKTGDRLSGAK